MNFVMILRITLQREINLSLPSISSPCSFGINVRNVALKALRIRLVLLDCSTTSQISSFTKSQQLWKKSIVNPSNLGAFPLSIWKIASSTSCHSMVLISIVLCSGMTSLGIFLVIFAMYLPRFSFVSLSSSEKSWMSCCSGSLCFSTTCSSRYLSHVIWLC